jgi:hypothetical protein
VKFLFVYVREAHPSDGWQMPQNEEQKVIFAQPRTIAERREIAGVCCTKLKMTMPCVVDTIDNKVDQAYAGWPERLFIVNPRGTIAYAGQVGPFGFDPAEVEAWLRKNLPGAGM